MKIPKDQIGIGDVNFPKKSLQLINQVIKSRRLSYGPITQEFERQMARIHNRKFAYFCNSGTSALQVAVHACKKQFGWNDGDEVLVPAVTFIATSNVIIQNNLKPVFVDVDPIHFELDPTKIEAKITPKTRAIMPVHLFGQPCEMEPIMAIAKKYNLRVIEDSCEAMFAKYKGAPVGSWGDVACFSTYATHLLVTGVGGFAMTNDPDLAVRIKSLFNHGRDGIYVSIDDDKIDDPDKLFTVVERRFSFTDVGYSYRGTELEAAVGLGQLEMLPEIVEKRNENAEYLLKGLEDLSDWLQLPQIRPETEHAFMLFPLLLKPGEIRRTDLVKFLEEYKVETRFMMPLLSQPIYKELFGDILDQYPVAKLTDERGFIIGCHDKLTKKELDHIIDVFHQFFKFYTLSHSDLVHIIRSQEQLILQLSGKQKKLRGKKIRQENSLGNGIINFNSAKKIEA